MTETKTWGQEGGNYVFPPKQGGEPIKVKVLDVKRVEYPNDPDKCYKSQTKNFGYRDEFQLADGKVMPCNTWKLYFAITKDSGSHPGDTLLISHPGRGEYKVEVVKEELAEDWAE